MHFVASFITDPRKFFEFPFTIMQMTGDFVITIMQQAFKFASEIGKISV